MSCYQNAHTKNGGCPYYFYPSEINRVMYKYGGVGNDSILTQSEAAAFE